MPIRGKIIVLRFSAMGDVAMVASLLREFSVQYPDAEIIMVSRSLFKPFFKDIPNVTFHSFLPITAHKGILGMFKLYQELRKYKPLALADLHDNLRSRLISTFFRFTSVKIKRIDKGRAEKRALTRKDNKILQPLKHTIDRYSAVFNGLGFNLKLKNHLVKQSIEVSENAAALFKNTNQKRIGISPFAQHEYKVYSQEKMATVIAGLNALNFQVLLFGGGDEEKRLANILQNNLPNVKNLIGNFNLEEELAIISQLDLMLSMDSAGMHMASLMGVPVISIWGPTHPYAGFLGYGQQMEDCLQVNHPARPNSIYGNKPCICDGVPCIDLIEPEEVINKIKERLNNE